MSDYTKEVDFAAKDALASGNASKVAKGTEVDTEFNNIATAVATKFDSSDRGVASGLASLDSSTLILASELPAATTIAKGSLEIATSAEANALTAADKIIVPSVFSGAASAWGDLNAGMATDIQSLADPNADRILFWDDNVGAAALLTVGDGLDLSLTTLSLAATTAGAGLTHSSGILAVGGGSGITANADDVAITNVVAGAAQPVVITAGTFTFDLSSITTITGPNLDQAADGFLINDAGTLKVLPIDAAGVLVVTQDAIQTFAITDANTMQVLTGITDRIWTIPPNSTVSFEIGTIIIVQNSGTGNLTITAGTGVILDSLFHTAAATAQSDRVIDGGTAALIQTAIDTWAFSGDISDS